MYQVKVDKNGVEFGERSHEQGARAPIKWADTRCTILGGAIYLLDFHAHWIRLARRSTEPNPINKFIEGNTVQTADRKQNKFRVFLCSPCLAPILIDTHRTKRTIAFEIQIHIERNLISFVDLLIHSPSGQTHESFAEKKRSNVIWIHNWIGAWNRMRQFLINLWLNRICRISVSSQTNICARQIHFFSQHSHPSSTVHHHIRAPIPNAPAISPSSSREKIIWWSWCQRIPLFWANCATNSLPNARMPHLRPNTKHPKTIWYKMNAARKYRFKRTKERRIELNNIWIAKASCAIVCLHLPLPALSFRSKMYSSSHFASKWICV